MERSRRCARTVKPPTPTRAISSIPSVAAVSETVSGLMMLLDATDAGVDTCGPIFDGFTPGALNRTVVWVGAVT